MISFFIYFLLFTAPGFIAVLAYEAVSGRRIGQRIRFAGLSAVFDLVIFLPVLTGLYFVKAVYTQALLIPHFDCMSFRGQYALPAILTTIVLGLVAGGLGRAIDLIFGRTI